MRLAGVDLNLLVAFDALLSERSVSRAATRMSVGQSAMSSTLGRLRRLFDDPLLVRHGRHLVPTPLAMSLIDPVHEILSSVETTLGRARPAFDPAADQRTFTIATSDYVTLVFLRPLVVALTHEAPGIRVHLQPVTWDFRDRLRRNLVDLLIMPSELLGQEHEFPTAALFDDRFVCVVDRDNPDVGDTMTVDQFGTQPYLAYTVGSLASLADRQLEEAGTTRTADVSVETFLLVPHLLRGSRLFTLLLERLAHTMQEQVGLRVIEPPVRLRPVTEVMAWAPRHEHDPAHVWLRRRLTDLAADL